MPGIEVGAILRDIGTLGRKASMGRDTVFNRDSDLYGDYVDIHYAASLLNSLRDTLRHVYVLLSLDDSDVRPPVSDINSVFNDVAQDNYCSVLDEIANLCKSSIKDYDEMQTNLEGNDKTSRKIRSDTERLTELLNNLETTLYSGTSVESQTVSSVTIDDIDVGDLLVAHNLSDGTCEFELCISKTQTPTGSTIGTIPSYSISPEFVEYYFPDDFMTDTISTMRNALEYLLSLEGKVLMADELHDAMRLILLVMSDELDASAILGDDSL